LCSASSTTHWRKLVPDSLMTYYPETIRFDPDLTTKTGLYRLSNRSSPRLPMGLRKPDRLSVTEVAEKYVKIRSDR
jgi:hypothetical protein